MNGHLVPSMDADTPRDIPKMPPEEKGEFTMISRRTRGLWLLASAAALLGLAPLTPASGATAAPPVALTLTSITIDPEDADGATTNAPGAWSTNTGDPLCQVGVWQGGRLLNEPVGPNPLGEISVPLRVGRTTLRLVGDGVFPGNQYYGAVLFFNGRATPPQIAVYNGNGQSTPFRTQNVGTQIMGGANGGLFFDSAPGTFAYGVDGYLVWVNSFQINASTSSTDRVSCGGIGANGTPDMVATLTLTVMKA